MTAELPAVAELELFLSSWVAQHGDDDYLLDAIIPEGGYAPLTISGLRAVIADLRNARGEAVPNQATRDAFGRLGDTVERRERP